MLRLCLAVLVSFASAIAAPLRAGAAKVDITEPSLPANDRMYARALVVQDGVSTLALITLDVVAIEEIGPIRNGYLAAVRARLQNELNIRPEHVVVNVSHCHGIVAADVVDRTVQAVKQAAKGMVPVKTGAGKGRETRIMENRRVRLKNGREADVRHAYTMPPDEEVAGVGPVDPEIGILKFERQDGTTLAAVYHFSMHPIMGVPSGANTADITGFSSKVIEENLGGGAIALFVQGCGGDINPRWYKDVDHVRDAETYGNLLGLSVLQALRTIRTGETAEFRVLQERVAIPRANLAGPIQRLEAEQAELLNSLAGTTLNLKTFLSLSAKMGISAEYPTYYSHSYLQNKDLGRDDLQKLDEENRRGVAAYRKNIYIMEQLARNRINLDLLKAHQKRNQAANFQPVNAEVMGIRVGQFFLVTFPGELTVQIGLNLKGASPHPLTFVSGYTNGYMYYTPTAEQLKNVGHAQEDSDCYVAPEWQALFEAKALELIRKL